MDKIIFYPLGKGWEKVFVFFLAEIFCFYTASQNFISRKYGKLFQDAISQQTKTDIDWLSQFRGRQARHERYPSEIKEKIPDMEKLACKYWLSFFLSISYYYF